MIYVCIDDHADQVYIPVSHTHTGREREIGKVREREKPLVVNT